MTVGDQSLRRSSSLGAGIRGRGQGGSAATLLTVYLVLLFAVPSFVTIGPLASLGRPSLIWGVFLLFWWVLSRLQQHSPDALAVFQPLRYAFVALVIVALVSFAAAMLRGQPTDQISPATTSLLRLGSWGGVFLVAMDGLRTQEDVAKLVRRVAVGGAALAALGLAQFVTGQTLLDWISQIPGLTVDGSALVVRGQFTRASGTAIHPLEYGTAVVASLPLAITAAVSGGFRALHRRNAGWWWVAVALIIVASVIAVSRSAIIGLAVAVIFTLPAVPAVFRWVICVGGGILSFIILAVVPGLLGALSGLFLGASNDPSTQSRSNGLARVPDFLASSPLIGHGFGTFLPRYYIFDNGWALLLVELGVLGVLCFGSLVAFAIGTGYWASRRSSRAETKSMGRALSASMVTIAVLMLFFDGLSFPMSAGLLFLVAGLVAATRRVAVTGDHSTPAAGGFAIGDALDAKTPMRTVATEDG